MTIDEAIKIKEQNRRWDVICPTRKVIEADDLSIEALKRIIEQRAEMMRLYPMLLPGETND